MCGRSEAALPFAERWRWPFDNLGREAGPFGCAQDDSQEERRGEAGGAWHVDKSLRRK